MSTSNANAIAIAGGAISIALFDVLMQKGALTADEARLILNTASNRVAAYAETTGIGDVRHALTVIRSVSAALS